MAKKKESKVSFNSIDKLLSNVDLSPVAAQIEINGEQLEFFVKPLLDPATFGAMVRSTVEPLFDLSEDGFEVYRPELRSIIMADAIMIFVANFKTEMKLDQVVTLMCTTDIMDKIYSIWSAKQRQDYESAVCEAVNARRDMIASTEKAKLISMSQQLDSLIAIVSQAASAFGDVDQEVMEGALHNMASITGEDIIGAVAKARKEVSTVTA